tara:strand:- start:676 stop:1320 length:645 start_codon:yes stop_codon:yes gene_type:complete
MSSECNWDSDRKRTELVKYIVTKKNVIELDWKLVRKKKKSKKTDSQLNLGFLSGFACGIFIAFLVYLWSSSLPRPLDILSILRDRVASLVPSNALPGSELDVQGEQSHPTFYKYLPGEEVPVPLMNPNVDGGTLDERGSVFLQVGSYSKFEDADRQKAKLALLGVVASIESTKGGDSAVWYRVKIGPLSKESARQVKSRLVEEKFEVLVLIKDG